MERSTVFSWESGHRELCAEGRMEWPGAGQMCWSVKFFKVNLRPVIYFMSEMC